MVGLQASHARGLWDRPQVVKGWPGTRKHGVLHVCCSHAESYSVYHPRVKDFRVVGVSPLTLALGSAAAGSPGTFSRSVHGRDVA